MRRLKLILYTPNTPVGHRFFVLPGSNINEDVATRLCEKVTREGSSSDGDWMAVAQPMQQLLMGSGRTGLAIAIVSGFTTIVPQSVVADVECRLHQLLDFAPDLARQFDRRELEVNPVETQKLIPFFNLAWEQYATISSRSNAPQQLSKSPPLAPLFAIAIVLIGFVIYQTHHYFGTASQPPSAGIPTLQSDDASNPLDAKLINSRQNYLTALLQLGLSSDSHSSFGTPSQQVDLDPWKRLEKYSENYATVLSESKVQERASILRIDWSGERDSARQWASILHRQLTVVIEGGAELAAISSTPPDALIQPEAFIPNSTMSYQMSLGTVLRNPVHIMLTVNANSAGSYMATNHLLVSFSTDKDAPDSIAAHFDNGPTIRVILHHVSNPSVVQEVLSYIQPRLTAVIKLQ